MLPSFRLNATGIFLSLLSISAVVCAPVTDGDAALASPGSGILHRSAAPQKPTDDPFYIPPPGFEKESAGAILRVRNIKPALFSLKPDFGVDAVQILYRTTAIDGSPITTATTVFKPLGAKRDAFISFQTAYDSSNLDCSPSYIYQLGSKLNNLISSGEQALVEVFLRAGITVASADYEGPEAAFGAARLSGMATLDSMRAVASHEWFSNNPSIVGIGYSGGSIATGWAASLQHSYAPELNIKGWVSGGTAANITAAVLFNSGKTYNGFMPITLNGLLKKTAYGKNLNPLFDKILTRLGRSQLDVANKHCAVTNVVQFSEQSILSTEFQTLGQRVLSVPEFSAALADGSMGSKEHTPIAPVLLYHATRDQVTPYDDAKKLKEKWCENGVDVKFLTFTAGAHLTTEPLALYDILAFVHDAWNGNITKGCFDETRESDNPKLLNAILNLDSGLSHLLDILADLVR